MSRDALAKWIEFVTPGRSPDGARSGGTGSCDGARTDRSIGTAQATIVGEEASLAWTIGSDWQGQGYAKEVAAALAWWAKAHGMVWLRAAIHPDHEASAAVAASIGMAPTPETVDGEVVWRGLPPTT